ncbi:myb/SANT-like DNA-binding domain-containing protein 1 [Scyliorhinus canicula]|uniref:myb/SANT-like DNA-binding domain-containing protein 1 n=1 Tax=Scyliorhinus canicula TaxID=7830 RepID=UPI0018F500F4|nr:myb/SANT-like DNA-binding domain-containing protein 1 [Scyliorhinus canicula]
MAACNSGSNSNLAAQIDKPKRSSNWTEVETSALIRIWNEYLSDLRTAKRNAKVYEKIAEEFFEATGISRDKDQIRTKVTNLTFQYRKLKATCGSVASSSYWPYYEAIHSMLAQFPGQDEISISESGLQIPSVSKSEAPSPPPKPTSLPNVSDDILISEGSSCESDLIENSSSFHSSQLRYGPPPIKKRKTSNAELHKKRIKLMESMLEEQKKISAAVEETNREVQRILDQQTLLLNQSLQLQKHMLHLLEKVVCQHGAKKPNVF